MKVCWILFEKPTTTSYGNQTSTRHWVNKSEKRVRAYITIHEIWSKKKDKKKMDREWEMSHRSAFWEKSQTCKPSVQKHFLLFQYEHFVFSPVKSTQKCKLLNKNEGCQWLKIHIMIKLNIYIYIYIYIYISILYKNKIKIIIITESLCYLFGNTECSETVCSIKI